MLRSTGGKPGAFRILLVSFLLLSSFKKCAQSAHGVPCAAVRTGRKGPAGGIGMNANAFSPGQEPCRKARPVLTNPKGAAPGCPSLWLLSLGHARESDSGPEGHESPPQASNLARLHTRQQNSNSPTTMNVSDIRHQTAGNGGTPVGDPFESSAIITNRPVVHTRRSPVSGSSAVISTSTFMELRPVPTMRATNSTN